MDSKRDVIFRFLDYGLAMSLGGAVTLFAVILVPDGWSRFIGMVLGMLLGMAVLLGVLFLIQLISTPFEVAMPGMIIVMIMGMIGGMSTSLEDDNWTSLVTIGLSVGFLVQLIFHLYDRSLHGQVTIVDPSYRTGQSSETG